MTDTTDIAARSRTALVISTNYGTEHAEIDQPVRALRDAGVAVTVAAVEDGPIRTLVGDADPGPDVSSDTTLAAVDARDHDVVIVPGGTLNADTLRLNEDAQRLVREFADAGKPVAAVCHGPWLLVETALSAGRTLTSYPSLRTDITNSGGDWVDREVVVDDAHGFALITSRNPDDLPAFSAAIIDAIGASAGG